MKKNILMILMFLLCDIFSFANKNSSVTIIEHYESKKIIVQDKVKESEEISETKEYYSNGKIKKETKIVNGEGRTTTYYENGKVETITPYKDGKINGTKKEFDSNGKLLKETLYKDGEEIKK